MDSHQIMCGVEGLRKKTKILGKDHQIFLKYTKTAYQQRLESNASLYIKRVFYSLKWEDFWF